MLLWDSLRMWKSSGKKIPIDKHMELIMLTLLATIFTIPKIQIICDNSHICGRRDTLLKVAQKALDLNFDGLMTEVHPRPDDAWSDAKQQITPSTFGELIEQLIVRKQSSNDLEFQESLENIRHQIDEIDDEVMHLLGNRMQLAEKIGEYKKKNNISILQASRWNEILENAIAKGKAFGLSEGFVASFLQAIHQESINHQADVMNREIVEH
mgnify:CR=1 FL=1